MDIKKGTHEEYNIDLFMPVMKEASGKYIAVLSDNSTDRDEESLSKGCVEALGQDNSYLAALCNHNNDVFMQVAEWTNKGVREIDGYTALVAEPKFFMSNPKAKILKGMLDEGAKLGVSIGAIVKNYDDTSNGRVFTELELVEASFVAIPSNRHGRAMAVAKSFKQKIGGNTMNKEFTQKDLDSALEKSTSELTKGFEAQIAEKSTEISKLNEDLEASKKASEELSKAVEAAKEEATKVAEATEKKLSEASEELEKSKKSALEKQNFANQGSDKKTKLSDEDVSKAFESGQVPVMRF